MRFVKFRSRLNECRAAFPIGRVYFEEVRKHAGTDAAHVYGGLMGILTEWCEDNRIPYEGVPVGTIKKHWTGKGNASKKEMLDECFEREIPVQDDNEADAVALFDYAMKTDMENDTWQQEETTPTYPQPTSTP